MIGPYDLWDRHSSRCHSPVLCSDVSGHRRRSGGSAAGNRLQPGAHLPGQREHDRGSPPHLHALHCVDEAAVNAAAPQVSTNLDFIFLLKLNYCRLL